MKKSKTLKVGEEDLLELSEETKRDIEEARTDIKAGRFYTLSEVKKRLGLVSKRVSKT